MKKMMTLVMVMMTMTLGIAAQTEESNYLSAQRIIAVKGETAVLPVSLNNANDISAFSFELCLPEGVSIATNTDGTYGVKGTSRFKDQMLSVNYAEGKYYVAALSLTSAALTGTSGPICEVPLTVSSNVASGIYPVTIQAIELAQCDATKHNPAAVNTTIQVAAVEALASYGQFSKEPWPAKYYYAYDTNRDVAENWYTADFDESQWGNIEGPISKDGVLPYYATQWTINKTNYWVRRHFTLPVRDLNATYYFRVRHDDGCVAYLNGQVIYNVTNSTGDTGFVLTAEQVQALQSGDNVLAVWVDDSGGGDMCMDFGLYKFNSTSPTIDCPSDVVINSTRNYSPDFAQWVVDGSTITSTNHSASTSEYAITFTCEDSVFVSFDYAVSSIDANYGVFYCYIDGTEQFNKSGSVATTTYSRFLPEGEHTLKFTYNHKKDGEQEGITDNAIVSNIFIQDLEEYFEPLRDLIVHTPDVTILSVTNDINENGISPWRNNGDGTITSTNHSGSSELVVTFSCESPTIFSFDYDVSARDTYYDHGNRIDGYFYYSHDGTSQFSANGTSIKNVYHCYFSAGTHTVLFGFSHSYRNSAPTETYRDDAILSNISILNSATYTSLIANLVETTDDVDFEVTTSDPNNGSHYFFPWTIANDSITSTNHSDTSDFTITFTCNEPTFFSFDYDVSTRDTYYDHGNRIDGYFRIYRDGVNYFNRNGNSSNTYYDYFPAGTHTICFFFSHDYRSSSPTESYRDDVKITNISLKNLSTYTMPLKELVDRTDDVVIDTLTNDAGNDADYLWKIGMDSITSINHSGKSDFVLEITNEKPAIISFNYDVSTRDTYYDHGNRIDGLFRFYRDGDQELSFNSKVVNTHYGYLPAGKHTLIFSFQHDYSSSAPTDTYRDDVIISNITIRNIEESYELREIESVSPGKLGAEAVDLEFNGKKATLPDVRVLRIKSGTLNADDWAQLKTNMTNLLYLDISGISNTSIAADQFNGKTSLQKIILPSELKSIEQKAFYNHHFFGELELPEGLESIGNEAFRSENGNSRVTKIKLPSTITTIGTTVFYNNNFLTEFDFNHIAIDVTQSFLHHCDQLATLKNTENIGALNSSAFSTDPVLVELGGMKPKTIANEAFRDCYRIAAIDLSTATSIGERSFYNCDSLKTIDLSSVVSIGSEAFRYSDGITSVSLPECLETLSSHAFRECQGLTDVTIPHVATIGSESFRSCQSLQHVTIGDGVTAVGDAAFYDCNKLEDVVIGNNVVTLGNDAIGHCDVLKDITIGSSLATMGSNLFVNCPAIENIWLAAPAPPVVNTNLPFNDAVTKTATLYVPSFAMVSYKLDNYWSRFLNYENNENPIDALRLSGTLELTSNNRIPGAPDITLICNSHFAINGTTPQTLGNIYIQSGCSVLDGNKPSTIVSYCPNVTEEDVLLEYYMRGAYWFYLSFPFDVAFSDISTKNGASFVVYTYDGQARADNGTNGSAWTKLSEEDVLATGRGYIIQLSGTDWLCVKATAESAAQLFRTDAVTTALAANTSETADSGTPNAGWNFVGNPYPAYYDIYYMDYSAPITVWHEGNRNYTAYTAADDNYALSPYQAFFVQRPAALESVTFQPDGRQPNTTIDHSFFAPRLRTTDFADRAVVNILLTDGTIEDRTRLVRNAAYTDGYEAECDAAKMMGDASVPQLYSLRDDVRYAIAEGPQKGSTALGAYLPADGTYTLYISRADAEVELTDLETGIVTTLDEPYTFVSAAGTFEERFEIRFTGTTRITDVEEDAKADEMYDLQGRRIVEPTTGVYIQNGKKVLTK